MDGFYIERSAAKHNYTTTPINQERVHQQLYELECDESIPEVNSRNIDEEPLYIFYEFNEKNDLPGKWLGFREANRFSPLYLNYLEAQRRGGGTQLFRHMMKKSFSDSYLGKVHFTAYFSSHFFYLLMGCVPNNRFLPYLLYKFTWSHLKSVESFVITGNTSHFILENLREILAARQKREAANITCREIEQNREIFRQLLLRRVSFITKVFIPQVLQILSARPQDEGRRYDTSSLGNVEMHVSKMGRRRWKETLDKGEPFAPFREFEPLRKYMTQKQRERIDQLLMKH